MPPSTCVSTIRMEDISEEDFYGGITILIWNYHALNKNIFECVVNEIQQTTNSNFIQEYEEHKETCSNISETEFRTVLGAPKLRSNDCKGFILKCTLLTKKASDDINCIFLIDLVKNIFIAKFHCENIDDFKIELKDGKIFIEILKSRFSKEHSERWAQFVLRPKFFKWCESSPKNINQKCIKIKKSLQLVDVTLYNNLYKLLKEKYSQQLLQIWNDCNESTDPLKFIYEDLSIAAYLICLWKNCNTRPQAFADLGCGNGLLVYILNQEGFSGYGYELRCRKIWAYYPTNVKLYETPVEPDNFVMPSDVDWLIGNHSDELSPWLPVFSATLSYTTSYFLLPCCAFEFSGAKFQRRDAKVSVYQDYLQYLQRISDECGFETLIDRLKIPSTKRIALIGINRTHTDVDYRVRCAEIQKFVSTERSDYSINGSTWEIRNKLEAVKNCTQIEKSFLDKLVLEIFNLLLNISDVTKTDWRVGGQLSIREIALSLPKDTLKRIKTECGGIKTLLRNKHEVFESFGKDLIGIRYPKPHLQTSDNNKLKTIKKRACFFMQYHPQGCPLNDNECTFIH